MRASSSTASTSTQASTALGDAAVEAGAGEGAEFANRVSRVAPIGPEPAAPGKGAGGGEVRVADIVAQSAQRVGGYRRRHPLGRESGPYPVQWLAAAMQRLGPRRGIGSVVEQPRDGVTFEQRLDQRRRQRRGGGGMAPRPLGQDTPQICRRTGKPREITLRPAVDERGGDGAVAAVFAPRIAPRTAHR